MAYVRKETKLHLVHLMLLTHSSPFLLLLQLLLLDTENKTYHAIRQ